MPPGLFAVCPHDTARGFDRWALFNTVTNKALAIGGRFEAYLDFATFGRDLGDGKFLWAYVNPADFVTLQTRQGYVPVARPAGRYDVARIVTHGREGVTALPEGARVAAVPGYLCRVVKHTLGQRAVGFVEVPAKSYNDVMTLLRRGEADFGITYNEHFDALAASSREGFSVVESFDAGLTHVVAAHPDMPGATREALRGFLMAAEPGPDVKKAWDALGLRAFEAVPEGPYAQLRAILGLG